jgi:hypothetical protein
MAFGSSARPRTTFSETVEAQEAHGGMFASVSGVYRVMHADPETTYRFVRVSGTFWGAII